MAGNGHGSQIRHKIDDQEIVVGDDEEPEVNYRGIRAMPYIIGNETFEKLGALGTLANLQVYLTTVFNMSRVSATTLLSIFSGTTNFATLLGAFFSDAYFGRYKTLGFGSVASFLGLLVITMTAVFKRLHPPHCASDAERCVGATAWQMAVLLFGFGLMIVGAGAIRPCNLAFGADQFNPKTEAGKRGIDSFFNWYFFTLTFAQMVSVTLVVYVQSDVSWPIGLAIPTLFMLISCFLFFLGTKIYVIVKPEGSFLTSLAQVVAVAARKRRLKRPHQPWLTLHKYAPPKSINSKLPYTDQFRFLDKAAMITPGDEINPDGSPADPWRLCSLQQVEETKCVLRVIPIWAAAILYHVGEKQQYIVFQAMQSDRHLGGGGFQIPPATYNIFSMLTLTLWVPVYDRAVVPLLRRVTGKPSGITVLQRIGIGIFLTIVESLVGAFVEERRRSLATAQPVAHSHRGAVSSMSAMWLVPQLVLAGLAESFSAIGQVEFFYKQFPENMRSIAGSFFFLGTAAANYLNGLLITVVHRTTEGSPAGNWLPEDLNKGRLDYFYYLVAGLCFLNFGYFVMCARWYNYKGSGESVEHQMAEKEKIDRDLDSRVV
ncbi:protein NRT1/ PTR FAMILY 2.11-like [Salvia miltiorrhiza]|uniref:protein NRT1/ PTR FAMILY 2.11-like n=1 Tax=Salvia miltiorrhiza TaxID=226208 RepID=UPI0025AD707F|nr:protein NRT1/ PTR FAMILY 2.11-like [Salvia miltiorrhiza]XP_057806374.1 protein NRT1/ PTR FAMILY 2.11-like [Salvia miltiorrhiza]